MINKVQQSEKGYLILEGTIAKVGNLNYVNPDGSIRTEYVPPSTLFDEDHLISTANADFVEGHPAMINSTNYKKYTIGTVGSTVKAHVVKNDADEPIDGYVSVIYTVRHQDAVEKIKRRKLTGLSMGYKALTEKKDERLIQTKRICNHHGLVQVPRCEGAHLHLDSGDDSIWTFSEDQYEINYDEFIKPLVKNKQFFFLSW